MENKILNKHFIRRGLILLKKIDLDQGSNVSILAITSKTTYSHTSKLVCLLYNNGLIEYKNVDKRSKLCYLTDKGRKIIVAYDTIIKIMKQK